MIFVTVGTQLHFDRMVRAVDEWATRRGRTDVVAQVGPSQMQFRSLQASAFFPPAQTRAHMRDATLIVAHAGMGTILSALELGTPLVIMPRRADLGEQRNDHQLATARHFSSKPGVSVVMDETELVARLDEPPRPVEGGRISSHASPQLLAYVRSFIHGTC